MCALSCKNVNCPLEPTETKLNTPDERQQLFDILAYLEKPVDTKQKLIYLCFLIGAAALNGTMLYVIVLTDISPRGLISLSFLSGATLMGFLMMHGQKKQNDVLSTYVDKSKIIARLKELS